MATSTSTILFTDVVGSTLLRSRLGEDEADRVFRGLERSFADVVTAQAGRVVKTGGDGIMAAFDSSTDAVRAAVALQQRASRDFPELRVRVGAAAGDVSWEDGDCFGMPVVTAARLQARAEGGQILVTAIVRGLAGDRSGMTFRALGVMDLAGVPHPVDAFEVGWSLMPAQDARSAFDVPLPAAVRLDPTFSFVGREAEWGQLNVAWRAAQREQRRTCLLGGEAGAGKTRLAFEFARHCAEEGAAVVLGV